MLGHVTVLSLVFLETSTLFSIVIVPIYIPTNSIGGFLNSIQGVNILFMTNFKQLVCNNQYAKMLEYLTIGAQREQVSANHRK